jgi:hypothetical protein
VSRANATPRSRSIRRESKTTSAAVRSPSGRQAELRAAPKKNSRPEIAGRPSPSDRACMHCEGRRVRRTIRSINVQQPAWGARDVELIERAGWTTNHHVGPVVVLPAPPLLYPTSHVPSPRAAELLHRLAVASSTPPRTLEKTAGWHCSATPVCGSCEPSTIVCSLTTQQAGNTWV